MLYISYIRVTIKVKELRMAQSKQQNKKEAEKPVKKISIKSLLSKAEAIVGLLILGALAFHGLEELIDGKPALTGAVSAIVVFFLLRTQVKGGK